MGSPRVIDIRLVQTRRDTCRATRDGVSLDVESFDRRELLAILAASMESDPPGRFVAVCERAVSESHPRAQLHMLAEECSELAVAAHHAARGRDGARAEVVEELADVMITSMQAQIILGITADELHAAVEHKLSRLERRLDGGTP